MTKDIKWPVSSGPIITGKFIRRPNRFLVECKTEERGPVSAHLPNPGRLWELFLPDATLYLHEAKRTKRKGAAPRKTQFTVMAVERQGYPVFLHTHTTNQVAHYLIQNKRIPGLKGAQVVRPEISVGRNRFDFLLKKNGKDCYLEVKSCTQFGNGVAMFPDAVTQRGRRHILELADMAREGISTAVLFLVHHPHVTWFMPDFHTDPDFSSAFLSVRNDVQIIPAALSWKKDLTLALPVKKLKIPWRYLEREVNDVGSYLLVIRLDRNLKIRVGRLGPIPFSKGYFVYVGSAMKRLSARISRHRNKDKTCRWHIDYLTAQADHVLALPVRSSKRLECNISRKVAAILEPGPTGFGSSDCSCPTHLFQSPKNPLHDRAVHVMLQSFRMRHHR